MSEFDESFLAGSDASVQAYRAAMDSAVAIVLRDLASLKAPYQGPSAAELEKIISQIDMCPEDGVGLEAALELVGRTVLRNSIVVSDPACLGHLHCAPLIPALAAESLISAANQSMDSWDQAPAATYLEQRVIAWLCRLFGLGELADGIFTSGGTQSNFMGLLLARDVAAQRNDGWRVQDRGLPPHASTFRILCSEDAHFSVRQSAAILGLGQDAVITVQTDSKRRMDPLAAAQIVSDLFKIGHRPIAIVATAGTTDFGAIDPLSELAALARQNNLWLHVDAAYGGALAISDKHRHLLDAVQLADSVTVDFHKLFYQPISCSALLIRDRVGFDAIRLHAAYLNPEENEANGVLDLVSKSIQTTRRFDALKPFVTLQALGRKRLAAMIDRTIEVARATADLITADPELELAVPPSLNALLLRFKPRAMDQAALDGINRAIQQRLLLEGHAMLGRTKFRGRTFMKITLINPRTTLSHIEGILSRLKSLGHEELSKAALGETS